MRTSKVLYSAAMSLDGFIAGPGGDMQWMAGLAAGHRDDPDPTVLGASIGSLLVGRTTFDGDDPNRGTDAEGAFGGTWHGPTVLLTHRPAPAGLDDDVTVVGDLREALAAAKAAADGRYVNVLGADVARQCLEAGELDEVLVFLVPVLLGGGTRLLDRPDGPAVALDPLDPELDGTTRLWFSVRR